MSIFHYMPSPSWKINLMRTCLEEEKKVVWVGKVYIDVPEQSMHHKYYLLNEGLLSIQCSNFHFKLFV